MLRFPLNVGFIVFESLEELDLVGPYEVLSCVNEFRKNAVNAFTVAHFSEPVRCANGLRILPDYTFETCPPIDIMVIPGGNGRRKAMHDEELLDFVRTRSREAKFVTSVCTGSFILAKAGLLDGKRATTWHGALKELKRFEKILVCKERVIHDGNIVTAAGVSSGIDMALYLVNLIFGKDIADKVAEYIEYKRY